ncbi:SMI1/KNR4 family protein [Mucilaginibacter sp. CSA2-8R]|uniref:SMI1/KNR4 family protein n=1 Tax=Mucilaginibacter sp. CSA2-8R TaxID=3141542 RepID=UPI00315C6B47
MTDNAHTLNWLHFADCMNNGGTSELMIDFSPSPTGTHGQVIRYLHDPDEITVIAESFEAYLQMLINKDYDFIQEDTLG